MEKVKQKWREILMRDLGEYKLIRANIMCLIGHQLSAIELDVLILDTIDLLQDMSVLDIKTFMSYMDEALDEMEADCLENELYESCANIRDFRKMLLNEKNVIKWID